MRKCIFALNFIKHSIMKKKIKSWCATIALVGTVLVGFTACSQDDIFDEALNETEISTLAKRSMQQGGEATPEAIPGKVDVKMELTDSIPEYEWDDLYPELTFDTDEFIAKVRYEYKKEGKGKIKVTVTSTNVDNPWFRIDNASISETFLPGHYLVSVSGSDVRGNLYGGQETIILP